MNRTLATLAALLALAGTAHAEPLPRCIAKRIVATYSPENVANVKDGKVIDVPSDVSRANRSAITTASAAVVEETTGRGAGRMRALLIATLGRAE